MRKILGFVLLLSGVATAETHFVTIKGKQYPTGLLRRTENMPAPKFKQFKMRGDLPESYDARDHELVTTIKNQGACGSCWSFARTKALEAATIISGRATIDELNMSEQDTLVNDKFSFGCDGGFMDGRFETTAGVTTEKNCPYRASTRFSCRGAKFAKATNWSMIGESDRAPTADELRQAIVDYGVIAVTVAAGSTFAPNASGRITQCGSRTLNHMVNLVGYRLAPNGGYEFLIANSWGTGWGDGGYAWSKQGCNQLASVPGEAALFFYTDAQ